MKKKFSKQQLERIQLAERVRLIELKKLCDKYLITQGMNAQEIFNAFVDVEQASRPEFMANGERSTDIAKRFYWFQRASGLTTAGGQNRLKKLLQLAVPVKEAA